RDAGGRVVLFVDELHELFVPGVLDDVAAEVKLGVSRGELGLVSATTTEEPAYLLLRSVADGLGRHHGLAYGDEVVAATVSWSIRYLPGRALPDKAISV